MLNHPVIALARKDVMLLLRNRVAVFFTVVFPIAFGVLFGLLFSGTQSAAPNLAVALVDLDDTPGSKRYAQILAELDIQAAPTTQDEARRAVRLGATTAAVVIEQGFQEKLPRALAGDGPTVTLLTDPAREMEAGLLRGMLNAASGRLLAERAGLETPANPPVRVEHQTLQPTRGRPRTAFELTFPQACAWALMGCVTGFAGSIVDERSRGTIMRLAVGPLRRWHILLGKGLACFVVCLTMLIGLLAVGTLLGVRFERPLQLAVAIVAIALAFSALMMLLAALLRDQQSAEGASRAVLLLLALLGGGGVPLIFFQDWLRAAAGVSPFMWAILAIENASYRDATWLEAVPALATLLGTAAFSLVAGIIAFARWPFSDR